MTSGLSIRQACRSLNLSRTVYHYRPDTTRDEPVIVALQAMAERYPRYGFPKLFQVLRRQGYPWNHKRIHRIYCLLKLNFRRKGKQRLPVRNPSPLATPEALNQSWSVDFMHDALVCGCRFRTFNVVDDFNREALSIEIDLNLQLCASSGYSTGSRQIAAIRSCYAWIMVRNLSHLYWLNGQSNMQ
ncbi:Low calcium response locus protein T (modular protein) [Citrobacter amalonaticus]|uniref:Low calcium response locus protein T (Modular protein) n=2 Tax=Citrobacter TaxID=544 RepID=A0AAX2BHD8_CITAM|nr:Low calcium response locus protein T (modular protein) [Citrobacter amalonaticus]SBA10538.1 Low calcium response locus protein T (modular protein) [Citrobacter amalonaticus]SBV68017.1 Low calcium response locus protein T (modular protein) [uncultured Citrobacter sp.]